MKTTIYLVRHGETPWNKEKRLQGQKDIPLSEEGIKQAEALSETIKRHEITKIYTSKLQRSILTTRIIAKHLNLPIKYLKSLNEISYGQWEGKLKHEYNEEIKKINMPYYRYAPKNGESNVKFKKRVIPSLKKILLKDAGEKILIVTHGAVIHAFIRYLRNIPYNKDLDLLFPNTCFSIYHIENGKVTEELFADTSHLII
ncbi:histidine phosphatase family protein [Patescibacteria group bacterium]|nr:histidine phosphatase family protein [Patescibacteria group bacterium]